MLGWYLSLEVRCLEHQLSNITDGDLILLVDRQDDGINLLVLPHHPDEELGQVQGVDELAEGLASAPDLKVLALLAGNVGLMDQSCKKSSFIEARK